MNTLVFERRHASLRRLIDRKLASLATRSEPRDLMEGSRYVLRTKGKRVRSTMLMLSCEAVGGKTRDALDAAVALEMLHNFTLVHDDVMDNAPSRRGRPTVHMRWSVNNAILVGDVILGMAYRTLLHSRTKAIRRIVQLFTDGFVEVCEGQAFDVACERNSATSLREYYRMVDKKTGKLFATATQLGALLGNGTPAQSEALRVFGRHIGRAFQIQDDLLDVIAEEAQFGKRIGGDIIEGKMTFLLVEALRRTKGPRNRRLRSLMARRSQIITAKERRSLVREVSTLYKGSGAIDAARRHIAAETDAGIRSLRILPPTTARATLEWLAARLVQRSH